MERTFTMELAGKTITVEIGKYAEQASGTCLIRCGDTALLVCATGSKEPREGIDFFPLTCDYEEKMYAVGKIPGGFIRREGRPSEKAVLTCRLMDRPLRPLFPKGFHHDVQVVATALSVDTDIPPEIYAMNGASIALSISHLPFMGPIGAVSVGYVDGTYIVNPDMAQREASRLDLTVAGTKDAVMMVEAGANEMTEQEMLDAILFGHEAIKEIVAFIEEIQREVGKEKMEVLSPETNGELAEQVEAFSRDKIAWSLDTFDRVERQNREDAVKKEVLSHFEETYPECAREIDGILYNLNKEMVRKRITQEGIRPDGRTTVEVRPIWGEVSVLKRPHGSAVFTRGQTQVMTVMTLGPMSEVQKIDGLSEEEFKRYMHQYNMPPYSVGEARPMRGPGRREIGHGALASRALEPMIPSIEEFPYALRLVSEVISSNGSTSMASVCASTMALMDGGVPIKKPVAGVAMGLIQDSDDPGHITVLTDIQGLEDFLGDMDFKVAGTRDGITAIQMDIKIRGISREILETALAQAKEGRMHILGKMMEVIDIPRESLSEYAPKIIIFKINPEKIGEVVGPRGKNINRIIAETGVKVDIEDDGTVYIATNDDMAAATARKMIETVAKEIEVGETYLGTVVRIMPFGAFVELSPGKDGLVHISKLAKERVNKVEDVVNIGDEILVKVVEIDEKGRINLTRKDLLPD